MKPFHLTIVTPESLLLEKEVGQVTLPIEDGAVTILADHEPYIGVCTAGELLIRSEEKPAEIFALSRGFVEFHENKLVVLADRAEAAADIDIERAEAARKRAQELMLETDVLDEDAYERTRLILEKELNRVRVAERHGRPQSHRVAPKEPL